MSIAETIIYQDTDALATQLASEVKLDEIDEYGYTPLVQTAIVNSIDKAKLILAAGADIEFTDLTGRTALHWAVDNNNYEFCRMLLEHGANANTYSRAGQPALSLPLQRSQIRLKHLLYDNGANLSFAQDFINAKLLGHRFELEGRVDIINHENTFIEIELEGYYPEFTIDFIAHSLQDYKNSFKGRHQRKHFRHIKTILSMLHNARELLKYQHYLVDVKEHADKIDSLLDKRPLMLPVAYDGHAVSFILYDDYLIRCDRGEFGAKNGTAIIYQINNPHQLSKRFLKTLLYKRQHKDYIDHGLAEELGLEPVYTLPLSPQLTGNCSWANIEASVPSLLSFLHWLEDEQTAQTALQFYQHWQQWDRHRSLQFCIDSFYQSDSARKAAKAALLAAILFQHCNYDDALNRDWANRILNILSIPDYDYIISSYLKIFQQDQQNPYYTGFINHLDDHGIDIERYL